jgi:hypothetical protein
MERCPSSEPNVEKFPAVYVTLVFMPMVKGPYHWFLHSTRSIRSISSPHPFEISINIIRGTGIAQSV